MGCCGGRRSKQNPRPISNPESQEGLVLLTYTGLKAAPITVAGPVTGRNYQFSKFSHIKPVAVGDVPGLIATGAFQR